MDEYRKFQAGAWHGEVLEGYQDEFDLEHLEEWIQANATRTVRKLPLRAIYFQERPRKPDWYLKILWGIGDSREALSAALKWRLRSSRFLQVLRISQQMKEAEILCPRVILAARKRAWRPLGRPTDVIVMEAAPGRLVSNYLWSMDGLPALTGTPRQELLQRMGEELCRFHQAGFVHGDCHPGNYTWQEGMDGFCYIDNDRTCRHARRNLSGAMRNLVSAGFYLLHRNRVTPQEWEVILDAYLQDAGLSMTQAQAFRDSVNRTVQKRIADEKR